MRKLLFIHNGATSFVRMDLEELRRSHTVTECFFKSRRFNPMSLWSKVKDHDLVFGWFASWHTWLPMEFARLLGKPSVLIVGGYDVANLPEIGYGHQRGGLKKWVSRQTMSLATCLITNSLYSCDEAVRNAEILNKRLHVIYHGVPDLVGNISPEPRARTILTVGNVDRPNLGRKGHEAFVRTAALMLDSDFVLVGAWKDEAIEFLRAIATPNVTFPGRVSDRELQEYYLKASVYVQTSLHEGFGLSVAESMLAGCVPVVTRIGALPEVVGECGEYVDSIKPHDIARAIRTALNYSEAARAGSRQRILDEFPMEKRSRALEDIVAGLLIRSSDPNLPHSRN